MPVVAYLQVYECILTSPVYVNEEEGIGGQRRVNKMGSGHLLMEKALASLSSGGVLYFAL